MNMSVLHNVTPIKMEPHDNFDPTNTSLCAKADDSSYFSLEDWARGDVELTPDNRISKSAILCEDPGSLTSSISSTPIRKTLFPCAERGCDVPDSSLKRRNLSGMMQNENEPHLQPQPQLQQQQQQQQANNNNNAQGFFNVWNESTQPSFSISETEGPLVNSVQLDLFSEYNITTFGNDQNDVQNNEQEPSDLAPVPAFSSSTNVPTDENGYTCAPQYNNSLMRYTTELPQHNNATSLSSALVTQPNLVHQQTNMGYQSSSPNNVDGTNSTHSSPYTPSPNGGYEYPTSPPTSKPSIPTITDYAGEYDFQINFGEATESAPKSAQYTYSHQLNKLFVKMNVTCPVRFKCTRPPPMNSVIRAVAVFKRPEHVTDIVTRCPNHRIPDESGYLPSSHLIRAEMPNDSNVRYETAAQDGRESVTVFYERPQVGAEYTTVLYKFMCLSSCVGGINRRPLLTVFTLEHDGQVLGRRVVEVRICSCPGRDRTQEERKQRTHYNGSTAGCNENAAKRPYKNLQGTMEMVIPKKKKPCSGDQEEFVLKIRGREKFEIIRKVKEALDLMDHVSNEQIAAYRRKEDEDQGKQSPCRSSSSDENRPVPQQQHEKQCDLRVPVTSVFTVADPLSAAAAPSGTQSFSMTPTHSSHPLTVTPTGEVPNDVAGSVGFSYVDQQQAQSSSFPSSSFWNQGVGVGFDVPDGQSAREGPKLERQNTTDSQRFMNMLNAIPSSLIREGSGLSTISNNSSLRSGLPNAARHVTRVMLRQTISVNRNAGEFPQSVNDDNKEPNASNYNMPDLVASSDSTLWMGNVKTEKVDEATICGQQNETNASSNLEFL